MTLVVVIWNNVITPLLKYTCL